jgi:hypothetical protein
MFHREFVSIPPDGVLTGGKNEGCFAVVCPNRGPGYLCPVQPAGTGGACQTVPRPQQVHVR